MPNNKRAEIERKRGIVQHFDHEQARMIGSALRAYAAVLNAVDRGFPDPHMRQEAELALLMSDTFFNANQMRSFLEGED